MADKTPTAVLQKVYVQGCISMRSADVLVKALGLSGVSKSQVLRRAVSSMSVFGPC
jgi:putative transposase